MVTDPRLTVADVARIYGVTQPTVRAWVRDGLLPCIRFRSILRFRPEDLRAMEARLWQDRGLTGQTTGCDKTVLAFGKSTGRKMEGRDVSASELRTRWKPGDAPINSSPSATSSE